MNKFFKRFAAASLVVLMLFTNTISAFASEVTDSSAGGPTESTVSSEVASTPDSQSSDSSSEAPSSSGSPGDESASPAESASVEPETPVEEQLSTDEPPTETAPSEEFQYLEIFDSTVSIEAGAGESVELFVALNRQDVAVSYQWQKLYTPPAEEGNSDEVVADEEFQVGGYAFLFEDMTESELLEWNPSATWQGIELWQEAVEIAGGDASLVSVPRGAKTLADVTIQGFTYSDSEGFVASEPEPGPQWENIEGATQSIYAHTVTEEDANTVYRCVITITDEAYFAAAATAAGATSEDGFGEATDTVTVYNGVPVVSVLQTVDMAVLIKAAEITPVVGFRAMARAMSASPALAGVRQEGDWLVGVDRSMEYITKDAFDNFGASAANNPYWTRLAVDSNGFGGTRPDGSRYAALSIARSGKLPVLSAWYGETIYVRLSGSAGTGVAINIPAYTGVDFQSGQRTVYKNAVSVLVVRVPETPSDFYSEYLSGIINPDNDYRLVGTTTGTSILWSRAPLTPHNGRYPICFNTDPDLFLKDAEGNFIYDSVAVGVNVGEEPDLSGKAAHALENFIADGRGFLIGHDMLYAYGGVHPDPNYVPDENSTTTPYYVLNTSINGHWNMNWLVGVNKLYTDASPYEAASMILSLGNYTDKTPLYGDDGYNSRLRIARTVSGNPTASPNLRTPTNYPYSSSLGGIPFTQGVEITTKATHSNLQIAYGTIWVDFASNSMQNLGIGRLVAHTNNGLRGTNNFYLTTNGNFAMNQIGHKADSYDAGAAQHSEMYLFANTILYISQRTQCQICQSQQGGNKDVHFVHRISSAEELAKMGDSRFWFTYDMDGCYMLANDVTLPDDWTPITGFFGHFHADGHRVTLGANGEPLFANDTGDRGEYSADATRKGWNLGTDPTQGVTQVMVTDAKGVAQRTTGIARFSGYLGTLFETGSQPDYSNYRVVVYAHDGREYSCITNLDGKYIISNVPVSLASGERNIMEARVWDSNGNEVTQYGPIRGELFDSQWETNETRELYLIGFKPTPVENREVYESQNAVMVEGGVYYPTEITNIQWQYRRPGTDIWADISVSGLDYTINPSTFTPPAGLAEGFTETTITINNAKMSASGYQFRAVFTSDNGVKKNTADVQTTGHTGLLTVLPRPITVTHPLDVTVFADETATFTSTAQFFQQFGSNFDVRWQFRTAGTNWQDLDASYMLAGAYMTNSSAAAPSDPTGLQPYLNTAKLVIPNAPLGLTHYQFQAVYQHINDVGRTYTESFVVGSPTTGREGWLTVRPPAITATMSGNQTANAVVTGAVEENQVVSTDTVTYTSVVTFAPGRISGQDTVNLPNIQWMYKSNVSGQYAPWNQVVARMLYPDSNIVVNISRGAPVATGNFDNEYSVTTTMTMTNVPILMDTGATHHWFIVDAQTTHLSNNVRTRSDNADLTVSCPIQIHHKDYVAADNGNGSNTYTYPNLEIIAPRGLRQMTVQFTNAQRDSRDTINLPSMPAGISVSGNNTIGYTFKSTSGDLIPYTTWQNLARAVTWTTYDASGTSIYWRIDEIVKSASYNSETGHFYEYVSADGINWTDAKAAANGYYNADIGAIGYLANIGDANENAFVQQIAQNNYVWIGGTKDNAYTQLGANWAWMPAANPSGTALGYTNWSSGQPATDDAAKLYMAMNTNGTWTAQRNDIYKNINLVDKNQTTGNNGYYNDFGILWLIGTDVGNTWSPSTSLVQGHTYYFSSSYGDFGDANMGVTLSFPAFNINDQRGASADIHVETSKLHTFTGTSGNYSFTYRNAYVGANISGNGGYVYYIDIYDLTEAYGAGNEPTLEWCNQNLKNTRSKNVLIQSAVTDKAGYVIEYGVDGDTLDRLPNSAYDADIIGGGTFVKNDIIVEISASDKLYDRTETNAVVTVRRADGANLSDAERNSILAGLRVQYTPGNTTAANATGSGAINARNYGARVVIANSADPIWAQYSIDENSSGLSTSFTITPRAVHLVSANNDKIYDGLPDAAINNITFRAADATTGIVPGDAIGLNAGSYTGTYDGADQKKNQTNGEQVRILRNPSSLIELTNNANKNYYIASETYTGAISPRPLHIHSLYQDTDAENNPRNIKMYDGTNAAVIKGILIDNAVSGDDVWVDAASYAGTYADRNAGETLNADGTVLPDRFNNLTENAITRTAPIALINNDKGNYVIGSESYSGAIYRNAMIVKVANQSVMYGEGATLDMTTAGTYDSVEAGQASDLWVISLVPGDTLTIDDSLSWFEQSRDIDNTTPAGSYPVTYEGFTETNYPVLSNYVIMHQDGQVVVYPRPLTVTVDGGYEKLYGDPNPQFTVTIEGFADNGDNAGNSLGGTLRFATPCTQTSDVRYLSDGCTIVPYPVSAYGLTVPMNVNGWQNYEINYVDGDIKVLPLSITIQAIDKTKTYGRTDPYFDYTISVERVKESDLDFELTRIQGQDVGEYEIFLDQNKWLSQTDKGNYDITFIPAELTINPRPLYISTQDYTRYYGDENPEFEVVYSGFANGDSKETALVGSLEVDCSATRVSPVGSYNITLDGEAVKPNRNGLYNYRITYFDGSLNVLPRPITIIADDVFKYEGEPDPELTYTFANGETVVDPAGSPLVVELVRQPGEELYGTYPIYSDKEELDNQCDPSSAEHLNNENPNYDITYIPGNLIILKDGVTDLIIKVGNAQAVYGEPEPTDEYRLIWYMDESGQHELLEGTDIRDIASLGLYGGIVFDAEGDQPRNVGVYGITGTGLESSKYENVIIVPGKLTITPRPVTITPNDKTKVYGDADPVLDYQLYDELSDTLYVDGSDPAARIKPEDLSGSLSRRPGEDVGEYRINIGTLADPNYIITLERGVLEITPADLIVSVWNDSNNSNVFTKDYGDPLPAFGYAVEGLKNGDSISALDGAPVYDTGATKLSDVGEYPVSVSGFESDNYTIYYVDGVLRVEPKDIIVVVDNKAKEYGDPDPEFTYTTPDLPVGGTPVVIDLGRNPGEDVGAYIITGNPDPEDNPNYNVVVYPGTLVVTPATIVVSADDKSKTYGDENPVWTYTVTGLKNGDDESVLNGEVVFEVKEPNGIDVGRTTDIGEYPINISNSSTIDAGNNYVVVYEDGKLDILPPAGTPVRDIQVVKIADKTSVAVGETITYRLVITNTGNTVLTNVSVRDTNDGAGEITASSGNGYTYENGVFTIARLPMGEQLIITYTYTAVAEDAGKNITNVAVASIPTIPATPGNPETGDPGTPALPGKDVPSNEVEIPVDGRSLNVVKSADVETAYVGDTITYTLVVTNNGKTPLRNVSIDDGMNAAGEISATNGEGYAYAGGGVFNIAEIAVNTSVTITYTYVAQEADAGNVVNNVAIAKIPGTSASEPDLSVVKVADREVANVGDTIGYTLIVTNIGDYDLESVLITDEANGTGTIEAVNGAGYVYNGDGTFTIADINIGEAVIIRYTYEAMPEDAGNVVRTVAIAAIPTIPAVPADPEVPGDTGTPEIPGKEVPSDPVDVPVLGDDEPNIAVVKRADKAEAVVGEIINYTVVVTNTGNMALENVTLADDADGAGTIEAFDGDGYTYANGVFTIGSLLVSEQITIEYSYTAQAADAGNTIRNVAIGTIPTIPAVPANPEVPGDTGTPEIPGKDVPSEPVEVPVVNEKEPEEPAIEIPSNEVDVPIIDKEPNLSVIKSADKAMVKVGETINYTVKVTNTGNIDLANVQVRDENDGAGEITATGGAGYSYEDGVFTIGFLAVGQSIAITYSYTAVPADGGRYVTNVAVGLIPNLEDPDGPPTEKPSNPVEVPVDGRAISIVKRADKTSAKAGETINYTLVVTNTGTEDLTNIVVRDSMNGAGSIEAKNGAGYVYNGGSTFTITELKVGASIEIRYSYKVQAADAGKTIHNVAIAAIPATPGNGDNIPGFPAREIPSNAVDVPVTPIPVVNPGTGMDFLSQNLWIIAAIIALLGATVVTGLTVRKKRFAGEIEIVGEDDITIL